MSGTAAGDDADPPAGSRICAHDRPAVCIGSAQLVGVGQQDSVHRLVDEVLRGVDDLAQHVLLVGKAGRGAERRRHRLAVEPVGLRTSS